MDQIFPTFTATSIEQIQLAKEATITVLQELNNRSLIIFTDGSAGPNPGPCGDRTSLLHQQTPFPAIHYWRISGKT